MMRTRDPGHRRPLCEIGHPGAHALAWLAFAAAAPPAAGADDGGTRSVFAQGAGNRALALGGAYVAIADDAAAAAWNPGGLGFVERRSLEATHTNLFGLGFSEQYASFVLPSWRHGTASVTVRSFGVSGIEVRDDRNALLDDNLSSTEMEAALGFGRRVSDHWGFGGALKVQRQRVGDRSDLGIGIDLGVKSFLLAALGSSGALADHLAVGLSMRNAVRPMQKLDEESVADPSVVRAGLALRQRLGAGGAITWALDIESSSGVSPRLHAGLEVAPVPHLALRTGLDAAGVAAGAGVRLANLGMDYAFEDHSLGMVHRFGVRLVFGATTLERRRAHLLAEEIALQRKLSAAFEERTRARIDRLAAVIDADIQGGRASLALENVGTLKVIDPADPRIPALEARAFIAIGLEQEFRGDLAAAHISLGRASSLQPGDREAAEALRRVGERLASRTARSNEARELMRRALDALAGDQLARARAGFEAVLAVSPNDSDARRMLSRTTDAIARRVETLLTQAQMLADAGLFDDADASLNEALLLSPSSPEIDATGVAIRKLRHARAEPTLSSPPAGSAAVGSSGDEPVENTAGTAPRRLTSEERRQVEDLYRLGVEAAGKGRIDDALRYWEFVWSSDPTHGDVAEHLEREYLARGMEAFAAGRLADAVREWNEVLRIDPEDVRAKGYLRRAREQESRFRAIVDDARVAQEDR